MDISNKLFRNNKTGEVIRVIDSFETIAILENREKIDVRRLMDPSLYTEQIDPSIFFDNQSAYNSLAEKIKSIPTDKIPIDDTDSSIPVRISNNEFNIPPVDDSAIIMTTEEDERAELAKKYGINNTDDQVIKQNQAFAKLLGEEELDGLPIIPKESDDIIHIRVEDNKEAFYEINENKKTDDPILTIFKNIKRTKEFSINLEIKNKIPRYDFVEMMEDSYEISIIDFLSKEFTDNLLKNPHIIQNMIKEKIKDVVYGKKVVKPRKVKSNVEKIKKVVPNVPTKERVESNLSGDKKEKIKKVIKKETNKND